jgi:hypothetical protein
VKLENWRNRKTGINGRQLETGKIGKPVGIGRSKPTKVYFSLHVAEAEYSDLAT